MTEFAYYCVFLGLGSVVSYEDWRSKKIRNRLIAWGLAVCAAGLLLSLINTSLGAVRWRVLGLGEFFLPWSYYPRVLAHVLLSLVAGIALWLFSVWPAGDAKFFIVLSWLAALVDPNLPGFPNILCLLLLVNIFVPAGLFLVAESAVRWSLRLPELARARWGVWLKANADMFVVRAREAWPHRVEYAILTVDLIAAFLILQSALPPLGRILPGFWTSLALFLAMIAAWRTIVSQLTKKAVGVAVFAVLSAWIVAGALLWRWDVVGRVEAALRMALNFGMFLSFAQALFGRVLERESLRDLNEGGIGRGTILSDESWSRLAADEELSGELDGRSTDGLSDDEARVLRDWARRRGAGGLTIYETIPFAFWIFFGVLLTLSRRCNVVAVLIPYAARVRSLLPAAASRWLA